MHEKDVIQIQSTKIWEGHYFDVKDAYHSLSNASLNKNESIWILSNTTLKRVLKNVNEGIK